MLDDNNNGDHQTNANPILDSPIIEPLPDPAINPISTSLFGKDAAISGMADNYANGIYEGMSSNNLYPARILRWFTPAEFWITLIPLHERVKEMDRALNAFYQNLEPYLGGANPTSGTPCAFKHESSWKRGLMLHHQDETSMVRFVDEGRQQVIDTCTIKPLLSIFASIPPIAIRTRIYGTRDRDLDYKVLDKAVRYFEPLTGRDLWCRFVDADRAPIYSLDTYRVELYGDHHLPRSLNRADDWSMIDLRFPWVPDGDMAAKSKIFKLYRRRWRSQGADPPIQIRPRRRQQNDGNSENDA